MPSASACPPAARRDALLAYLDDNPTISIGKYATLTGLSRKEASAELHFLADPATPDSILSTQSSARQRVFQDSPLRLQKNACWKPHISFAHHSFEVD